MNINFQLEGRRNNNTNCKILKFFLNHIIIQVVAFLKLICLSNPIHQKRFGKNKRSLDMEVAVMLEISIMDREKAEWYIC